MQFVDLEAYRVDRWRPADGRPVGLNLSGGRSSAYQLAHIVAANDGVPDGCIVNFANTGRERWETLAFVAAFDRWLGGGVVHCLEYDPTSASKMRRVKIDDLSRDGEPFEAFLSEIVPRRKDGTSGVRPLPNASKAGRSCTGHLKIRTLHRYARRVLGWGTDYYATLGYRADEKRRVERRRRADAKRWEEGGRGLFPMFEAGVDQDGVQRFWAAASFDLAIDSAHGNCDYCFMVSTWKLKERMLIEAMECQIKPHPGASPPPRLQVWIDNEDRANRTDRPGPFRKDRPGYRALWEQVCAGNMSSAVAEGRDDRCGSCGD